MIVIVDGNFFNIKHIIYIIDRYDKEFNLKKLFKFLYDFFF